jgi:gluconolactonase
MPGRTPLLHDGRLKGRPAHIRRFTVGADSHTLTGGEVFATCHVGLFDGFRLDVHSNVWTSAGDGVHCHAPGRRAARQDQCPRGRRQRLLGRPQRNRLFICGTTSLYSIFLFARGCTCPG